MNAKRFRQMELIGIPVCFVLAVMLHFVYQWSGFCAWVGVLAPANESVWEHGKLLIVPYALWAVAELIVIRPPVRRFVVAKTAGLYAMLAAMILFYYLYTWIAGRNLLAVDIFCTLAWIVMGFALSAVLVTGGVCVNAWFTAAAFALLLLLAAWLGFTINPPQCFLFEDPITGGYGLKSALLTSLIPV